MSEAAQSLGVSSSTLRRLVRQGELPVVTFCDRPLFRPSDLEALIERRSKPKQDADRTQTT